MQLYKKIKKIIKKITNKNSMLKFVYAWYYKHAKVNPKIVLFESFHGKDISDSPLYILKEFQNMPESQNCHVYFATNNYTAHKAYIDSIQLHVNLIDISTFKYVKILAKAKYLINNSSFPVYFIRRPEQTYLQTWHGTPLKTLGKEMRQGMESMYNVQHNFLQANYLMYPNSFTRDVMMRDYNLESTFTGKVVMNGYPRNTIFSDVQKRNEIRDFLNHQEITTMAYMPTWRGLNNYDTDSSSYLRIVTKMLSYLDNYLLDHQKLFVNFHSMVQNSVDFSEYKHIYPFPNTVEKYEFLNSVDVLITDYSSVFFDFSITRKPIILFMYDYDEYNSERGMYLDVKSLPFHQIFTIEDLKECLVSESFRQNDYSTNQDYFNKYIYYDNMENSKNMAKLVFRQDESHVEVIDYSHNKKKERTIFFPPNVKLPQTIDSIAEVVNPEKDIVLLEKRFFNPEMSAYLYDHYKDAFDFIFITKTLPRTYLEEVLSRFSPKLRRALSQRECLRCFGELPVRTDYKTHYYLGKAERTFSLPNINTLSVSLQVEQNELVLQLLDKDIHPTKLMVVNSTYIFWSRPLSENEKKIRTIHEDFHELLQSPIINKNGKYIVALECTDNTGHTTLYHLHDHELTRKMRIASQREQNYAFYMDPLLFEECPFEWNLADKDLPCIIPFITNNNEILSIHAGTLNTIPASIIQCTVDSYSKKKHTLQLKLTLPKIRGTVKDVILSYRSKIEEIQYSFNYTLKEHEDHITITANLDVLSVPLKELFWDVYVVAEIHNTSVLIGAKLNRIQLLKLRLKNDIALNEKTCIFPYSRRGRKLAYTVRPISENDKNIYRIKELFVIFVYAIGHFYWKRKRLWLVYEKFCSTAQDNGYYFFKYCMEQIPENNRKHIYYILDRNSPDWDKMQKYQNQIIPFMSFRHMLYALVAKIYIASDSKSHLYSWRPKPNFITSWIKKHRIFFLQHGVTALKKVDPLFGKQGSSPMTYFTTTSKYEQDIIVNYFGYKAKNAPILGFTRWDVLEDTSTIEHKIILAMPTWRVWLEDVSAEQFKQSDYYKNYSYLIQNPKLLQVLEKNNIEFIFYIHPKFRDYLQEFQANSSRIKFVPFGQVPLNDIIKKCHMLITDYSSVSWDVYYLGKPVLFYQFDYETYMQAHGSYMDMENELFGQRYLSCDQLIDGISQCVESNFKEAEKYRKLRDYYFMYRDNENSKRTYQYLLDKKY